MSLSVSAMNVFGLYAWAVSDLVSRSIYDVAPQSVVHPRSDYM